MYSLSGAIKISCSLVLTLRKVKSFWGLRSLTTDLALATSWVIFAAYLTLTSSFMKSDRIGIPSLFTITIPSTPLWDLILFNVSSISLYNMMRLIQHHVSIPKPSTPTIVCPSTFSYFIQWGLQNLGGKQIYEKSNKLSDRLWCLDLALEIHRWRIHFIIKNGKTKEGREGKDFIEGKDLLNSIRWHVQDC